MGQSPSGFDPKVVALAVLISLALVITFMPISPVEDVREYERLTTATSTRVIPDNVQFVSGVATVKKRYVVGYIQTGYGYYWYGYYYSSGGRQVIDISDHVDNYEVSPQSAGRSTITLYKEGSVFNVIRDVYAYDLQYRDETVVTSTTGVMTIPGRTDYIEYERTVTRTTTSSKMANVWVGSGISTGVGAMISLMIIAGLVMLAFFVRPGPRHAVTTASSSTSAPTFVTHGPAPAIRGPTQTKGLVCFGCGSAIPAGTSVCPRCGKQA